MGIEIWVLVALVAILAVYLLPFLVGRREVMRLSNAEDRYSSELRVLATGDALASDEACVSSGRAQIFRRRPEVKAMNRPAVRNVRALRTERELIRARQAHGEARERRRVAASHRAAVACTLLGVLLGLVVVCALTALPWWSLAVPGALLLVSVGAGRRAARASAALDLRERRRITDLEDELADLTGERSAAPTPVWSIKPKDLRKSALETASARAATTDGATADAERAGQRAERTSAGSEAPAVSRIGVAAAAPVAGAGVERSSEFAAGEAPAEVVEVIDSVEAVESAGADDRSSASEAGTARAPGRVDASGDESSTAAEEQSVDGEPAEAADSPAAAARSGEGAAVQHALRAVAWPVTELETDDGASSLDSAAALAGSGRAAVSKRATASERGAAPATPPQGWRPVHVPAPTYTLAARAPRRALEDLEETSFPSAPVPARPHSVRRLPTEGVEKEEIEFHPIDLDAVLEKRRAAGA
ncbi:hypothetical protein [Actinomyces gerencseriae]|uniref:hypothetical protein n=1 Tax=Actinomyces gerencseriae TaxID=52769 RepID=UPI000429877A|nr:hypothetical protein [Actinomyces gerencseriae]